MTRPKKRASEEPQSMPLDQTRPADPDDRQTSAGIAPAPEPAPEPEPESEPVKGAGARRPRPRKPTAGKPDSTEPVARTKGKGQAAPSEAPTPPPKSAAPPASGERRPRPSEPEPEVDRTQQLSAILTRGLDLAETGLTVGLVLVNRLGALAQETLDGVWAARSAPGQTPAPRPSATQMGAATEPSYSRAPPDASFADTADRSPPAESAAGSGTYCIMNRLPFGPDQAVSVSFAINNDSPANPKRVELRVEGFVGETFGRHLGSESFRIEPAVAVIAPMDFEKLVLHGHTPRDLVPDVYRGRVVVAAEQEFEILVRLAVSAPPESDSGDKPGGPSGTGAL
jgi:hypothetical protein